MTHLTQFINLQIPRTLLTRVISPQRPYNLTADKDQPSPKIYYSLLLFIFQNLHSLDYQKYATDSFCRKDYASVGLVTFTLLYFCIWPPGKVLAD